MAALDTSFLTKKVAGAPGYVWAGGGVAVLAYILSRRHKTAAAAAALTATTTPSLSSPNGSTTGAAVPGNLSGLPWTGVWNPPATTTVTPSPTLPANSIQAFIGQFANPTLPITEAQAEVAVTQAYEQLLGREPEAEANVQGWAGQIVQNQSYIPTLLAIGLSPEGQAHIKSLQSAATVTTPAVSGGPASSAVGNTNPAVLAATAAPSIASPTAGNLLLAPAYLKSGAAA